MDRTPVRIRHEVRLRVLDVVAVTDITPRMRRIRLGGAALAGFSSPGHADHVKVFFPEAGQPMVLPEVGPEGVQFPAGAPRPQMRDYTPRSYDPDALTLDIDFVLHGDGPASTWAAQATAGQQIVIGGPRGSLIVPTSYDWYLLVGDETGLPAIARRLEELPEGAPVTAIIEIADDAERQPLPTRAALSTIWVSRDGAEAGDADRLLSALGTFEVPTGDGHTFIAAEGNVVKKLRAYLVDERGFNLEWIRAGGYWLRGVADAHEPH